MNIAVINIKETLKFFFRMLGLILILIIASKILSNSGQSLKQIILYKNSQNLIEILKNNVPILNTEQKVKAIAKFNVSNIIATEIGMLNSDVYILTNNESKENAIETEKNSEQISNSSSQIEISKIAQTEEVTDKNYTSKANTYYGTTRIDNQTDYVLTEEMLTPDIEIENKKEVLIYHTHTCESYTPCETYNYTMTGNYRTTDSNFNMIRVGEELTTFLTQKGFNVVHDGTYHDYPSYSGSYSRSLETATNLLEQNPAGIVIDLHRDAVGNGDTYGPTIMVDGKRVAQLMFVIGTDGGGSEHPNWNKNLKIAIKIQEKANEMYPGLFRSIIVRNSRYNQHIANGACIIEVGATANTLGECLLSMQCLANILEEV